MKLKLISFTVCPFVQRAVIALNEKNIEHEVEYIDLSNKPDWFLKISPRGKVPLLLADDAILFESQAIVEFIDEVTGSPKLMPEDPVFRAKDRAWSSFCGEDLIMHFHSMVMAPEKEKTLEEVNFLKNKLTFLNLEIKGKDFLSGNGKNFGMADVMMTPFFYKVEVLKKMEKLDLLDDFENLQVWSKKLNKRESVINSVPKSYEEDDYNYFKKSNSWLFNNSLLN